MHNKILHSRKETAEILSISLRLVDYLIAAGVLPSRQVGRRRLVPRFAIEQFARQDHASAKTRRNDPTQSEGVS